MFVIVQRDTTNSYDRTYILTYTDTEAEAKAICRKLNKIDTTLTGYRESIEHREDWGGEWYEYQKLGTPNEIFVSVRETIEEENRKRKEEQIKDLKQDKACLETLIKVKAFFDQFDLEDVTDFVPLIPQMYEAYKATDMSLPISFFDGRYFYRKDGIRERRGEVPYGTMPIMIHAKSSYSSGYFIHNKYDIADDIKILKQAIAKAESR